jgi:hypothetical protein
MLSLPGMTTYRKEDYPTIKPFTNIPNNLPVTQRPIILLATALITEDNLFLNGLFQNIYVLYRMFEAMGNTPIMLVNTKPDNLNKIPKYMFNLRIMTGDDLVKQPIPVKVYIEIGMSMSADVHKFLKMCGAKICKLYLGNILNIDVENPMYLPQHNFAHHVKGLMDEIWTSPHYHMHDQYARALNFVDLEKKGSIAPYVWDSQILTNDGIRNFCWRRACSDAEDVFLVLEPNISFQKCSLMPLMILEAWFRKHPDWKGEVVLSNGERLLAVPFFRETIWKELDLVKAGRIKIKGRTDILTLLKEYPCAIPICHQWNNEYNYMVFEYFSCGFPVLHNASNWSPYGYYYSGSNIKEAVENIEKIRNGHQDNMEIFKAHTKQLLWKHSPYNPDIHREWAKLLGVEKV